MTQLPNDRLLVATRKGLFTLERGPESWRITQTAFLGDPVSAVLAVGPDRLYAALDHGHFGVKLQRSNDGGASWQEVAAPAFPPKPPELDDRNSEGKEIPWRVEKIWALEAGRDADDLWCGTLPGGLFRSRDGGASWELNRSLWDHPERRRWFGGGFDWPGIHSIVLDPRAPESVLIAISCGGVWRSDDDGASWRVQADGMRAEYMPPELASDPVVQDPHRLAACRDAPDHLWVQHHNGIFRSTDGGASWREIGGVPVSSFGFAVAVHPREPGAAWFVPAIKDERRIPVDGRLVVLRTRDGGASFDELRRGLPQEHAYDLVYRHGLAIDESGDRLAFGSTTGSLWLSEDQGDSWTALSYHLPPVYAVAFAPPRS